MLVTAISQVAAGLAIYSALPREPRAGSPKSRKPRRDYVPREPRAGIMCPGSRDGIMCPESRESIMCTGSRDGIMCPGTRECLPREPGKSGMAAGKVGNANR